MEVKLNNSNCPTYFWREYAGTKLRAGIITFNTDGSIINTPAVLGNDLYWVMSGNGRSYPFYDITGKQISEETFVRMSSTDTVFRPFIFDKIEDGYVTLDSEGTRNLDDGVKYKDLGTYAFIVNGKPLPIHTERRVFEYVNVVPDRPSDRGLSTTEAKSVISLETTLLKVTYSDSVFSIPIERIVLKKVMLSVRSYTDGANYWNEDELIDDVDDVPLLKGYRDFCSFRGSRSTTSNAIVSDLSHNYSTRMTSYLNRRGCDLTRLHRNENNDRYCFTAVLRDECCARNQAHLLEQLVRDASLRQVMPGTA
jgi:hypothetical protein